SSDLAMIARNSTTNRSTACWTLSEAIGALGALAGCGGQVAFGRLQETAGVAPLAGETARAEERIDRALARPDRRGLTTDGAEQARGRHALLRRIIRRTSEEERAERASWTGLGARVSTLAGALPRRLARWPDDERTTGVLADDRRLVDTLRPFMAGGIDGLSPWIA